MNSAKYLIRSILKGMFFISFTFNLWSPVKKKHQASQNTNSVSRSYLQDLGLAKRCSLPRRALVTPRPSLAALLSFEQDPLDGLDVSNPYIARAYPKMVELENSPQWKAVEALFKEVLAFLSDGLLNYNARISIYKSRGYVECLLNLLERFVVNFSITMPPHFNYALANTLLSCDALDSYDLGLILRLSIVWQALWHWLHISLIQEPPLRELLQDGYLCDFLTHESGSQFCSITWERIKVLRKLYVSVYNEPACMPEIAIIREQGEKNHPFRIQLLNACLYKSYVDGDSPEQQWIYGPVSERDGPIVEILNRLWLKNLRFYPGLLARYILRMQQEGDPASAAAIERFGLELDYFKQNLGSEYVCHEVYFQLQDWCSANKLIEVKRPELPDCSYGFLVAQTKIMIDAFIQNSAGKDGSARFKPLRQALANFGDLMHKELGLMAVKKAQQQDLNANCRTIVLYDVFNKGFRYAVNFWLQMYAEVYKNSSDFEALNEDEKSNLALNQLTLLWHLQALGVLTLGDKALWQEEVFYYIDKVQQSKKRLSRYNTALNASNQVSLCRMQAIMDQVYKYCAGIVIFNSIDSPYASKIIQGLLPEYESHYQGLMYQLKHSPKILCGQKGVVCDLISVVNRLQLSEFLIKPANEQMFHDINSYLLENYRFKAVNIFQAECTVPECLFMLDPFQASLPLENLTQEQEKRLELEAQETKCFAEIINLEKASQEELSLQQSVAALAQAEAQARQKVVVQEKVFWTKSGILQRACCLNEAAERLNIEKEFATGNRLLLESLNNAEQNLLILEEQEQRLELVLQEQLAVVPCKLIVLQLKETCKRLKGNILQERARSEIALVECLATEKAARLGLKQSAVIELMQHLQAFRRIKLSLQADDELQRLLGRVESRLRKVIQSQANLGLAQIMQAKALGVLVLQESDARVRLESQLTKDLDAVHHECISLPTSETHDGQECVFCLTQDVSTPVIQALNNTLDALSYFGQNYTQISYGPWAVPADLLFHYEIFLQCLIQGNKADLEAAADLLKQRCLVDPELFKKLGFFMTWSAKEGQYCSALHPNLRKIARIFLARIGWNWAGPPPKP